MIKKTLLFGTVCIVSITMLGWAKVTSHGSVLVQDVREGLNMASPDDHEADRIRHLLRDRQGELQQQHVKIQSIARKASVAERDCLVLEENIAKKVSILGRAHDVLSSDADVLNIGGRSYTRIQVEQDAREHMRSLEGLRIQYETKQSIARELTAAVSRHKADLAVAQQEVQKAEAGLETLDLRLQSAQMRRLAQELSEDLDMGKASNMSELGGSFDSYVARVEEAEARLGFMARVHGNVAVVDWEGNGAPGRLLDEIAQAVSGKREPSQVLVEPSAVAPASVGDAKAAAPSTAPWSAVVERQPAIDTQSDEPDSSANQAITTLLEETVLDHSFARATVQDWASYYAQVTGATFIVAPDVKELDAESTTLNEFCLSRRSVADALEAINAITGVAYKIQDGFVQLVKVARPLPAATAK